MKKKTIEALEKELRKHKEAIEKIERKLAKAKEESEDIRIIRNDEEPEKEYVPGQDDIDIGYYAFAFCPNVPKRRPRNISPVLQIMRNRGFHGLFDVGSLMLAFDGYPEALFDDMI